MKKITGAALDARHQQAVLALSQQVRAFYEQRKPFKVYHGSTNSTRVLSFDKNAMVDVSKFNRVLSVDASKKSSVVEPNVPMDKLVEATLPRGLIPPVVMEFPGITVGGGLQGGAGESSSFKWGTFNRTLNWYDIMLADGEVLRVSPRQHADLFWGGAGSYGSLGVVTAAQVKLIPAKRYVNMTYTPVKSFDEATNVLKKFVKENHDFVDGILYAPDCGVIITGKTSDKPTGPVQTFSRRTDPWFYLHAEKLARSGQTQHTSTPIKDYLFRYNRGAFWMGKAAFSRFNIPFNEVTRRMSDHLMHTRKLYDALQASGVSQECIIQDLALPAQNTNKFLEFVDDSFGIYPIWLCPLLPDRESFLLFNALTDAEAIINVGVWGLYRKPRNKCVAANRLIEDTVRKYGGKKWLYAESFYTEKKFWSMYDQRRYESLRKKYHAQTLPGLYQKAVVQKPVKVSAKRGLLFALLERNGIKVK